MEEFLFRTRVFSPHSAVTGALLALGLALIAPAAIAEDVIPVPPLAVKGTRVIEVNGAITQALVPKIRAALEAVESERFPAGAILLLDSSGGDGLAAIEIGRMARVSGVHVFVRNRCASACTYLLAGGVVRGVARDKAIGIHSPRLTTFVKGIGVVDINSASNPNAAKALELGNRRSQDYFREIGLPDAFYAAMMAAPADQTRYLDLAELSPLGLSGMDPAYLAVRAPAAAARYGIAEAEFERRTLSVARLCLEPKTTPREFMKCYARVLRTGA